MAVRKIGPEHRGQRASEAIRDGPCRCGTGSWREASDTSGSVQTTLALAAWMSHPTWICPRRGREGRSIFIFILVLVLAVSSVAVSVSVCTRVNTVRNWCLPCFAYSGVFCGMQVSVSGVMLSFELHYDTEYWYHTQLSAFGGRRNKKQAKI